MTQYRVGIIGTSADSPISRWHATAYTRRDDCELVAGCDIVREHAEQFAEEYGIPPNGVFDDVEEMLEAAQPDIVSVVTPPAAHAEPVIQCVRSGIPRAVHCEKPMAKTWKDARLMAQEARRFDVQLTFNHQRRFVQPWVRAGELLEEGAIGELERIELSAPNFFDWGSHLVDLANAFNDDRPVDWVIGQVDYRDENVTYGVHHENHLIATWQYQNGVTGLAATGVGARLLGPRDAAHRLLGTDGTIEINCAPHGEQALQLRRDDGWEGFEYGHEGLYATDHPDFDLEWRNPYFERAIDDVVEALANDRQSPLRAQNALTATEILFAAYESSRRRARVDLPLDIDDHPLESMVADGTLQPNLRAG